MGALFPIYGTYLIAFFCFVAVCVKVCEVFNKGEIVQYTIDNVRVSWLDMAPGKDGSLPALYNGLYFLIINLQSAWMASIALYPSSPNCDKDWDGMFRLVFLPFLSIWESFKDIIPSKYDVDFKDFFTMKFIVKMPDFKGFFEAFGEYPQFQSSVILSNMLTFLIRTKVEDMGGDGMDQGIGGLSSKFGNAFASV